MNQTSSPLVLAYFRSIYQGRVEISADGKIEVVPISNERLDGEELHLAYSRDGLHWTPLNGNRPTWPGTFVRDPFIGRGADGRFHLLATGGGGRRRCLYAVSSDLVTWDARRLPLMESRPEINNVWAPEWVWDADTGEYFVFWSSSDKAEGWQESRLWCARTPDFVTFSPPQVLLDPGYSAIDGSIIPYEGTVYLFFKEEMFGAVHGERRRIRLATAPTLDGPYTVHPDPVTRVITEGPAVLRAPDDSRWLMLYDWCMSNDYGASVSDDLVHWQEAQDFTFPQYARHGSVVSVAEEELAHLQRLFGAG